MAPVAATSSGTASTPTIHAPHPGQAFNGTVHPMPVALAPAARAVNATKVYGSKTTEVVALDDVSLDLPRGRFVAVMGPSGSGKSTLMHCLAGLDDLSSGEVFIGDANLSTMSEKERTLIRRQRVGFVFQAFNLIPTLTAEENITLPLDLAGRTVDQAWFDQILNAVGLRNRLGHKPDELSGGQQQRVAVSRALISRPEIIFADEPTGNLDSASGDEILSFMRRATDDFGQTIVMVTHDPISATYADNVLFLADGRIVDNLNNPTADSVLDRIRKLGS